MKISATLLLAAAAALGCACARTLQDEDIPVVGVVGDVLPIGENPTTTTDSEDSTSSTIVEEELVADLEADEQVTVVGSVQVGDLDCGTLGEAEDAPALQFTLVNNEVVIADQTSYVVTEVDGTSFKIWAGEVTDPAQSDTEAVPRAVSMTWVDDCSVETFLLKVTTRNTDGTTTVVKSVPCEAGSDTDICFVEILLEFEDILDEGVAIISTSASSGGRRLRASHFHTERKLTTTTSSATPTATTVVDVMVLYTGNALQSLGTVTANQMAAYIATSFVWTNIAFNNSGINLYFNLVHVDIAPFVESDSVLEALNQLKTDDTVAQLRDEYAADLVQLIGDFDTYCGVGNPYTGLPSSGYSVVKANCLDGYVHTSFFGTNMGGNYDRTSTTVNTAYSHGYRYCTGVDQYRTLMTTAFSCGTSPITLFFSNPNVDYLNKPTGTATEDNARTITENMVTVSEYKPDPDTSTPLPTPAPTDVPTPPPTPSPTPSNSEYEFLACYGDDKNDRVLSGSSYTSSTGMTIEECAQFCSGATYFGTEFSSECFCGNASDDPTEYGEATCDMECSGDAGRTCGGRNAISVYQYIDSPYTYVGCYVDDADRVLSGESQKGNPDMTTEVCGEFCDGSPYFGTEFGNECFCGVFGDDPTRLGEGSCNSACEGDDTEICGGRYAIDVYTYGALVIEIDPTSLGCYNDDKNDRIMTLEVTDSNMTTDQCEIMCSGHPYFGTQYGVECWCGDDDEYDRHGASDECDFPCGGDASEFCGGHTVMNVWQQV